MTLANEDLPQLKSYFYEWLAEADSSRRPGAFELSLQERLIRVEESLSNQIELTRQGFSAMDKRFEGMQEKMDKRFEAFQGQLDNRFEAALAQTDSRFEAMQTHLDKRFDAIGSDVRNLSQRMDKFMLWSFSTTVAGSGLVITVLKLWPPV